MAGKDDGSFGLDPALVKQINWDLALRRVVQDLGSDFIWAPHFRYICREAGTQLIELVKRELAAGQFSPGVPMTIEVPKSFRMRVGGSTKRFGPSFTRPGSILPLKDRLLYQAIGDRCLTFVEQKSLKDRSFSHRSAAANDDAMFMANRSCWNLLQEALSRHASKRKFQYVVKMDIANYFQSVNLHELVNTLSGNGLESALVYPLESMLVKYTGERSSRGIIQGVNTSDLFGAFYLHPIDRLMKDGKWTSARYVDDIYVFVSTLKEADKVIRTLVPKLRNYDLVLNEIKSVVMPTSLLRVEEPDLESLFGDAIEEISGQDDDALSEGYGHQRDWWDDEGDEDDVDDEDIELKATRLLFDSLADYPGQEEHIERFCIPLFARAESDYAIDHIMASFSQRPSMTQIYVHYLSKFVSRSNVTRFLEKALDDITLYDWQGMWVLAALMQRGKGSDSAVTSAWRILDDGRRHDAVRAVAALFVGRFGPHDMRWTPFVGPRGPLT